MKTVQITGRLALVVANVATTIIERLERQIEDRKAISVPGFVKAYNFSSELESRELIAEISDLRAQLMPEGEGLEV